MSKLDDLVQEITKLKAENKRLEEQELGGIECTLDMLIDKDDQEKWGLEKLEHTRNIQHIFSRLCHAFNETKAENKRLRDLFQEISDCEDARKKCGIGYHGYVDKIAKQALKRRQ